MVIGSVGYNPTMPHGFSRLVISHWSDHHWSQLPTGHPLVSYWLVSVFVPPSKRVWQATIWRGWREEIAGWTCFSTRWLKHPFSSIFTPGTLGKWSNLTNIFQLGWKKLKTPASFFQFNFISPRHPVIPPEKMFEGMFLGFKYLLRRWPWMYRFHERSFGAPFKPCTPCIREGLAWS